MRLKAAAQVLGAITGESTWVLDALAKEKESDSTSKHVFDQAAKFHKDIVKELTLAVSTPFDTDNSSSSSSVRAVCRRLTVYYP